MINLANINSQDMKSWIELAKHYKGVCITNSIRGDMSPVVIGERDGKVICSIVAPQVDKELGLKAAAMLRRGIDIDSIVMIVDAHISVSDSSKEEFLKKYKPGELQRMADEEGACETGLISDCLICHHIGKDKKIQMATVPYYYGKDSKIKWVNSEKFQETIVDEHDKDIRLEGSIPDAMRRIMDLPSFITDPGVLEVAKTLDVEGKDKMLYHMARALYTALDTNGYIVFDYMEHNKPWEEFKKNSLQPEN